MLTITLKNLRPEVKEYLERVLQWLKNVTKKPRDFHLKKALFWYLEDANKVIKYYEKKTKKRKPNWTKEDLLQRLALQNVSEREKELFRNLKKSQK